MRLLHNTHRGLTRQLACRRCLISLPFSENESEDVYADGVAQKMAMGSVRNACVSTINIRSARVNVRQALWRRITVT